MKDEKTQITIRCKQVVEYSQSVSVTQEQLEKLQELEDDMFVTGKDFYFVEQFIDPTDILDCDAEFTDFSIEIDQN